MTGPATHELRSLEKGGFQNPGVCLQAFPSFPSPTPSFLCWLSPQFRMGKIPFRFCSLVFLCSPTPRKRFLCRLPCSKNQGLSLRRTSPPRSAWFQELIKVKTHKGTSPCNQLQTSRFCQKSSRDDHNLVQLHWKKSLSVFFQRSWGERSP